VPAAPVSTFPLCSQMHIMFYHSVIQGLGLFICYIYIGKANLGAEINTTKETSENVAQRGIKPGSPDYRIP